jgi:kumamolisin
MAGALAMLIGREWGEHHARREARVPNMTNIHGNLVPLAGSERFHRSGAEVVRASDPDEPCEITVKVKRKAPLPEPGAAPLDRKEVLADYGADPKNIDLVEKVLTGLGLKLLSKSPETGSLEFVGPVSAMERAFGVKLSVVKHGDATYRGRVGVLHIPKELGSIVTGVFGLDTRPMVKHRRATPHRLATTEAAATSLPPPASRPWFTAPELGKAYAFADGDGAGQSIAILEFGGQFLPAALNDYWQLLGLPGTPPHVQVRNEGKLPAKERTDPGATGEVMLDIEVVASLCPKANLVVLFAPFTEKGWIANIDAILTDPAAPTVVSVSYGLAEGTAIWTQAAIDTINDALKAVAVAGVTVCVSAGDDGSDDQVGDGAAHVDFPTSSPYVLSVGGTSLRKMSNDEIVWFEGTGVRPEGGATGGGVSAMNARPPWQAAITIRSENPGAPNGRVIPDVAANAAGGTGYLIVAPNPKRPSQLIAQVVGGTSASTPLWASLLALLIAKGKKVGFLAPQLYAPNPNTGGKTLGQAACKDITSGENASGGAEGYSASRGFDAVTGWGSPNGANLMKFLP